MLVICTSSIFISESSPQKAPRDKIHIRASDGKLLSPQAEQEAILEHFTKVFSRDAANPHTTCCLQQPCPLLLDELLKAMQQQRGGRAIPPGSAPPELWKCLAPTLTPHVLPLINSYLDPGPLTFPSLWTDCWLKPLPKPTKPPNSAANLRPIALQDPLGKCIARTLKTRIQAEILARITSWSDSSLLLLCKKVAVPQPSTKLPEATSALTVCCVLGQTFACANFD